MDNLNWNKALVMGLVGIISALILLLGYAAGNLIVFTLGIIPTSDRIIATVVFFIFATVGGALPLRILGLGWKWSCIFAFVAQLLAYALLFVYPATINEIVFLTLGAWMTMILAAVSRKMLQPKDLVVLVVAGVTILVLAFLSDSIYVVFLSWIILPGITGLVAKPNSFKHFK